MINIETKIPPPIVGLIFGILINYTKDIFPILKIKNENIFGIFTIIVGLVCILSAINLFKKYSPDLVITDIYMPRKDGLDLIEAIRSVSKVPIIVESGGNISSLNHYFEYHQVARVLEKPFTAEELTSAVKEVLLKDRSTS